MIAIYSWGSFGFLGWLLLGAVAIIVLLAVVLRVSLPDFSLERVTQAMLPGREKVLLSIPYGLRFPLVGVVQRLVLTMVATPLLWGEEFGRRGYLQVRLMAHRPLLAALRTGQIWGLWHYPVNSQGYDYPDHRILSPPISPLLQCSFRASVGQTGF